MAAKRKTTKAPLSKETCTFCQTPGTVPALVTIAGKEWMLAYRVRCCPGNPLVLPMVLRQCTSPRDIGAQAGALHTNRG